jgi:Carboxypeptidase regulatory-like domain
MSIKKASLALAGAATLAAAIAACDDRNPTAPNPVPPPSATPAVYSLGGRVTEPLDIGIDGARVAIVDGASKGTSAITEGGGSYTLNVLEGTFTVEVTKEGYTSTKRQITVPQTYTASFEIAPLTPHANVSGAWNVTFRPHRTCPDLTSADDSKYRADIVQQGALIEVALSGATFVTPPRLSGTIHGTNVSIFLPGGCGYYCYGDPATLPAVAEVLPGNKALTFTGVVTASAGRDAITGTLEGQIEVVNSPTPPFQVLAGCYHNEHQVTFRK